MKFEFEVTFGEPFLANRRLELLALLIEIFDLLNLSSLEFSTLFGATSEGMIFELGNLLPPVFDVLLS